MEAFFDALGDDRAAALRLISTDAGSWISNVVDRRAPHAIPLHGPVSCRGVGDRRARRGPPPDVETTPAAPASVRSPASSQAPGMPCGATPRTSPRGRKRRWPTSPHQPPVVPGVPAESTATAGVRAGLRARRDQPARALTGVGLTIASAGLRQGRPQHPQTQDPDLRQRRARPVQRPRRERQHPHPSADPRRVRVPLTRCPHRPGHAPAISTGHCNSLGGLCPPLPGRN